MMMKRELVVLLLFLACSICFTQGLAANVDAAPPQPALKWPWFPWAHPHPLPLPPLPSHKFPGFPFVHPPLPAHKFPGFPFVHPPLPSHKRPVQPFKPPSLDPKVEKCLSSFQAEEKCIHEIFSSFWSRHVSIGSDCCKAIQAVSDDCSSTVFAHFNNPFFNLLLKEHCSNKAAPSPKA